MRGCRSGPQSDGHQDGIRCMRDVFGEPPVKDAGGGDRRQGGPSDHDAGLIVGERQREGRAPHGHVSPGALVPSTGGRTKVGGQLGETLQWAGTAQLWWPLELPVPTQLSPGPRRGREIFWKPGCLP